MTKITIISCIVAVCVFQTAKAGVFPVFPEFSLLDGVKKDLLENKDTVVSSINVSDLSKNYSGIKAKIGGFFEGLQNSAKEMENTIQNSVTKALNTLANGTACVETLNTSKEIVTEIISSVSSCVTNATASLGDDWKQLRDAVYNLRTSLSTIYEQLSKCANNPFAAVVCITNVVSQNISNVQSQLQQVLSSISPLKAIFGKVAICYQQSVYQVFNENGNKLRQNGEQCVKDVFGINSY